MDPWGLLWLLLVSLFVGRGLQVLGVISCIQEAEYSFLSSDKLSVLQKVVVINLFQLWFALCQLCEEHVQCNHSFQQLHFFQKHFASFGGCHHNPISTPANSN